MAMVDFNLWADELGVMLPGLTEMAAKQALGATFREFCVVSGAWVREIDPISIVADQATYEINPLSDATVLYIMAISYQPEQTDTNNRYSRFLQPSQEMYSRSRAAAPGSQPWGYVGNAEVPGQFTLVPTVGTNIADSLIPYVALGPINPFDGMFPASFQTYHFDKILTGAAARLMSYQDKPYTNLMVSQVYHKRFRAGMAEARDMARRQFTSAENDFVFPYWAAGGSNRTSWW